MYNNQFRQSLVFYINNTQNDYAVALRLIESIERFGLNVRWEQFQEAISLGIRKIAWLSLSEMKQPRELIMAADNEEGLTELNSKKTFECINLRESYSYVLIVKLESLNSSEEHEQTDNIDIVNLQYLVTAWNSYAGRMFIYLDNDANDPKITIGNYHKLSLYLYFATSQDQKLFRHSAPINDVVYFYNAIFACYYSSESDITDKEAPNKRQELSKRIQRLQHNHINLNGLKKFIPILLINKKTSELFSVSMRQAYEHSITSAFARDENRITFKEILKSMDSYLESDATATYGMQELALKRICLNYLLQKKAGLSLDELYDYESFDDMYGDMPMLCFYIYCIFEFFADTELKSNLEGDSYESRLKLISDVQDYASGIMELVDNVVRHSASHSGYLGIRIHMLQDPSKLKSLEFRCKGYSLLDKKTDYYLEICITDAYRPEFSQYSTSKELDEKIPGCIMINKFLENIALRHNEYSNEEKEKIDCFTEVFKHAKLQDFFAPVSKNGNPAIFGIENWDEYYSITSNILHHFGLMQFNSIIKSRNGYFRVKSCDTFNIIDKCQYCSCGNGFDESLYVPGTQYSIVLPIKLKPEQYSTGFSASSKEIDFYELAKLKQVPCQWCTNEYIGEIFTRNYKSINANSLASKAFSKELHGKFSSYLASISICHEDMLKSPVFSFSWNHFDVLHQEIFIKGLLDYINTTKEDRHYSNKLRIAIYGCTFAALLRCIEYFVSFYNRFSEREDMEFVDVYFVSKDYRTDFLISGKNLQNAVALSDRIAFSKGRFTVLNKIISSKLWRRLEDTPLLDRSKSENKYIPYDLLIKVNNCDTVFEKAVQETLRTDIQTIDFGCLVKNTHVRLGSKIHIAGDFFEAQVLFHTTYYVLRFAYLIASQIFTSILFPTADNLGDIVLLGYETYSELLIIAIENELQKLIDISKSSKIAGVKIKRAIYEVGEKSADSTLRWKMIDTQPLSPESNLVLIVPINSTLSTHNKVWWEVRKESIFAAISHPRYNMGVILIREGTQNYPQGMEKVYWREISVDQKIIKTDNLVEPDVHYLVSVNTYWEDPLKCKLCYPTDVESEKPLIETNKASVIPTQMIGLSNAFYTVSENENQSDQLKRLDAHEIKWDIMACNPLDSKWNGTAYRYGHIECLGNHFQYFFDAEAMLQNVNSDQELLKDLDLWLLELKEELLLKNETNLNTATIPEYHILIIPEHARNATWVDKIINSVFSNNPYVLRFNILKEFRDNVKAKYSNITTLYYNLLEANKEANIKFFFVDSTISSGKTLERADTLVRSLFPYQAFDPNNIVKLKLFEGVILFFNRSSIDTQRSYVDSGKFYSYINLHIPQLRNHVDACVLCNLEKQCQSLVKRSATNEMAMLWETKAERHKAIRLEDVEIKEKGLIKLYKQEGETQKGKARAEDIKIKADRAFRRLWCAEEAVTRLNALRNKKNIREDVEECIWGMLNSQYNTRASNYEKIEYLISFIKVLSRPPLVFRKSVLEAGFCIRLDILTAILDNRSDKDVHEYLRPIIQKVQLLKKPVDNVQNRQLRFDMILSLAKTLAGSLSKNGSNFMIRKETYLKMFDFVTGLSQSIIRDEGKLSDIIREFQFWYSVTVKRLIDANGDETKCLWLECLLLTGFEWNYAEPNPIGKDNAFISKYGVESEFGQRLFIENTRILYDGISDICKNMAQPDVAGFLDGKEKAPYYLKNFATFVKGDYEKRCTANEYESSLDGNIKNEIVAMRDMYRKLKESAQISVESNIAKELINTSEFYNNLAKVICNASGATKTYILGEVVHFDRYSEIKDSIFKYASKRCEIVTSGSDLKQIQDVLMKLTEVSPRPEQYEIAYYCKDTISTSPNVRSTIEGNPIAQFRKTVETNCNGSIDRIDTFIIDESRKTVIIKITDSRIQPMYIGLDFSSREGIAKADSMRLMLRGTRNILTFRQALIDRFERDFSSDLMPNYIQAKANTYLLSRKHGRGHTDDHKMTAIWEELKKDSAAVDAKYALGQTLHSYADQICGHLYLEYVQQQYKPIMFDFGKENKYPILSFAYQDLKHLASRNFCLRESANVAGKSDPIELHYMFEDQIGDDKVKVLGEDLKIITALLLLGQNAVKHAYGKTNREDPSSVYSEVNVSVKRDGEYLVVSNRMEINRETTLLAAVSDAKKKIDHSFGVTRGISLWTINQYIKDVLQKKECYDYRNELANAKTKKRIVDLTRSFLQKIYSLEEPCVQIEFVRKSSEADDVMMCIDEKGNKIALVEESYFLVRLPILSEKR